MLDWGEGSYERAAQTLLDATARAVDAAAFGKGARVLDLGCGTGNAALAAARRGASVIAVDPSARLLGVTADSAAGEGLSVETRQGAAEAIPCDDAAVDVLLSVFAVIFADDPTRAASEMMRVVRPGGTIVLTSWLPRGPIAEAGKVLREAMAAVTLAENAPRAAPRWGEPAFVRGLFDPLGGAVRIEDQAITFEAASPEAWFDEQEAHHPVWRAVRRALADQPDAWAAVRARSIACLAAGNEHPGDGFRAVSPYLLVIVSR